MWELDCEESWALKNWCFWSVAMNVVPLSSRPVTRATWSLHPVWEAAGAPKGFQGWRHWGQWPSLLLETLLQVIPAHPPSTTPLSMVWAVSGFSLCMCVGCCQPSGRSVTVWSEPSLLGHGKPGCLSFSCWGTDGMLDSASRFTKFQIWSQLGLRVLQSVFLGTTSRGLFLLMLPDLWPSTHRKPLPCLALWASLFQSPLSRVVAWILGQRPSFSGLPFADGQAGMATEPHSQPWLIGTDTKYRAGSREVPLTASSWCVIPILPRLCCCFSLSLQSKGNPEHLKESHCFSKLLKGRLRRQSLPSSEACGCKEAGPYLQASNAVQEYLVLGIKGLWHVLSVQRGWFWELRKNTHYCRELSRECPKYFSAKSWEERAHIPALHRTCAKGPAHRQCWCQCSHVIVPASCSHSHFKSLISLLGPCSSSRSKSWGALSLKVCFCHSWFLWKCFT